MPPPASLTIAVVGHDERAAQSRLPIVMSALHNGGSPAAAGLSAVAVAGGQNAAIDWLRADLERAPTASRLVVFPGASVDDALELLQYGASGVLADHLPAWVLRHAAAVVRRGGTFLDPWLAHGVADHARPHGANLAGVTGAEQRVLNLLVAGRDFPDIADELACSVDTVKGHVTHLQDRLGVTRAEMVKAARDLGLLPAGTNRARASAWDTIHGLHGLSVLVVGSERLAGESLASALRTAGAQVVGYAASNEDVATATEQWSVTVAVVRDTNPGLLQLRTAQPRAALVVVPWRLDGHLLRAALGARAQGIIGIGGGLSDLVAAIRVAAAAGLYLESAAIRLLLGAIDYRPRGPAGPLTVRQIEVLHLVDQGYSNRRIGAELGLAEPTVKGHVRRTLKQLGVADRQEAVASARRLGLLDRRYGSQ